MDLLEAYRQACQHLGVPPLEGGIDPVEATEPPTYERLIPWEDVRVRSKTATETVFHMCSVCCGPSVCRYELGGYVSGPQVTWYCKSHIPLLQGGGTLIWNDLNQK